MLPEHVSAHILGWITTYGSAAVFVLLVLGVGGLPVPDETLLTFAGVLLRRGHLHLLPTVLAAMLGSICGITVSYTIGRTLGVGIVDRYGRWLHITHADLHRVEQWMEHSGKWLLTFGYFIPGIRHLTAIVAGSSELPRQIFALYAYSGAVIWSMTFLTVGWYVGSRWEAVLARIQQHTIVAAIALGLPTLGYIVLHRWWIRRHRGGRA